MGWNIPRLALTEGGTQEGGNATLKYFECKVGSAVVERKEQKLA